VTWSLEQNPYGFIQSWLNARVMDHPEQRDRAYSVLKGLSRAPLLTRAADLARVAALAVPALAYSALESINGQGATMTIVARKRT
jgi:hypothetical protein